MPLPLTVCCFSKIQIGFSFLVPAHPGSPGKGPLNGYDFAIVDPTQPMGQPNPWTTLTWWHGMSCWLFADIEFDRRRKRRRLLREPSVSPIALDDGCDSDASLTFPSYSSPLRVDVSAVSRKEMLLKATFLSLHRLQPRDPHLKQSKLLFKNMHAFVPSVVLLQIYYQWRNSASNFSLCKCFCRFTINRTISEGVCIVHV